MSKMSMSFSFPIFIKQRVNRDAIETHCSTITTLDANITWLRTLYGLTDSQMLKIDHYGATKAPGL